MLPTLDHAALFRQDFADPCSERAVRVVSHRVCAPVDAAFVELACRTRPGVLPRWHQDDRGVCNASRGHRSFAPEGAYSQVAVWVSREHWLSTVVPVALAFHAETLHRRVSAGLMVRYLTVRSGYAVAGTGRRCVVRPATLASVLQTTTRTVQLCQQVARQIGLEVVIVAGRMLNVDECLAARRRGSRQRGLSTEVAFTTPRSIPRKLWINTPTSGTRLCPPPHLQTTHFRRTTAASGQRKAAASPRQPRRRRVDPVVVRRLALGVAQQLPWLSGQSPRRLAPALTRFVACSPPWEADDVVSALRDVATRKGKQSPTRNRDVQQPWALLAAMLRELDEVNDYPGNPFTDPAPVAPQPQCDRPNCDGWIPVLDTRCGADGAVRACPNREHRRAHHLDVDAMQWDGNECPF